MTVVATLQAYPGTSARVTVNHLANNTTLGEAQGVYSGTSFYGISGTFYSIVLPNDMYYAFYPDFWDRSEFDMMTGQGNSASETYTASLRNFFVDSLVPVKLTATYVPEVSMTGSIEVVANGYTTTFNAPALPSSLFEWDTPANLAKITGTWPTSVAINPDGTLTGSGACAFSGTITPDSSNKNFFNAAIMFGGAPCPSFMANKTGSGIAIETLLSDGIAQQLLIGGPVGDWSFVIAARR